MSDTNQTNQRPLMRKYRVEVNYQECYAIWVHASSEIEAIKQIAQLWDERDSHERFHLRYNHIDGIEVIESRD